MKKLGLICLVLVIAIGSIGIAYAKWSQNLTINGSVATGTYDTQFINVAGNRASGTGSISTSVDGAKHSITVILGATAALSPGCIETVTFNILNNGTIPAKIAAINVGTVDPPTLVLPQDLDIGGTSARDITVSFSGVTAGTTINAGATSGQCTLSFTTDSTADQNLASGNIYFRILTQQN
jgi:predicted ribosomally synthesized peptide with SipW-like signal peptide